MRLLYVRQITRTASLVMLAGRVRSPAVADETIRLERDIDRLRNEPADLAQHADLVMPRCLAGRLGAVETTIVNCVVVG